MDQAEINRNTQIKLDIAKNYEGPYTKTIASTYTQKPFCGVEERLRNIEHTLKISPQSSDIYARLKIIEKKILGIEQNHPKIAMKYFNYDPTKNPIPDQDVILKRRKRK